MSATMLALLLVTQHSSADLEQLQRGIRGLRSIAAWRVDAGRSVAEESLDKYPDDPITHALAAQVKMHMSDYAGAAEHFRRADRGGAPPDLLFDAPLAEAARIATAGYAEHVGDHFIVRHTPGRDAILVPYTQETLEQARDRIGDLLGWKPDSRVVVEIYPSPSTLAAVSSLTKEEIQNSGTIALCRWNRLMVTSPRAVVFGYSWRDTLAHELAHLIIGGASKNTVPIWLHEGIAKYVETAWRAEPGLGISVGQQQKLRAAAKKKKLIPFSKMHPSMAKLPTHEQTSLAFSEVFTFIEFLVERKGWEGMRAVLREMADGKTDAQAIEAVHGLSLKELEQRWKKTLLTRPIKDPNTTVKGDRKLVLKDRADAPDDKLHGLSKKGRRFARAADLLYARGRMKAAQKELSKAYDETKSPLISAKLATVALQVGDLDGAEKAARNALDGQQDLAGPSVTLAEILVRRNKMKEAGEQLARAIDINPFDPRIHQLALAVLGEDGDEEDRRAATMALALLSGERRVAAPTLGTGGLIRIEGRPFHRVFIRKEGEGPFIPTGMVTPTPEIPLKPGRFELMLVPPTGPSSTRVIEVNPTAEDGTPQTITAGPAGS